MKINQSLFVIVIVELASLPLSLGASSSSSEQECDSSSINPLVTKMNDLSLSPRNKNSEAIAQDADNSIVETLALVECEISADIREEMMHCPDIDCVEVLLSKVQKAPMDQKVELMMASEFCLASDHQIARAMKNGYNNYLGCLCAIMADYISADKVVAQSVAMLKDLVGNISILLGYAYGKSWCPDDIWNKLALQFGVCLFGGDNTKLVQDVLQNKESISEQMRKALMGQLNNDRWLENLAKQDAVGIFELIFERKRYDLDFELILRCGCMKILKFLSSWSIPLPKDDKRLLPSHRHALLKAIETNNLEVIQYLLKYRHPNMKLVDRISSFVSLDTLKLFFIDKRNKHVFRCTKFENVDFEGIEFLIRLDGFTGSWSPLEAIFERKDSGLKQWILGNWNHPQHLKDSSVWGKFIVPEFEFVEEVHGLYGFVPPRHALRIACERNQLRIVQWWQDVRPGDIIALFKE